MMEGIINEAGAVFDAVGRASKYVLLLDRKNQLVKQLRALRAEVCGNCFHWMKSSCVPEKQSKQFKSCNSCACKDFTLRHRPQLDLRLEQELAETVNSLTPPTTEAEAEQELTVEEMARELVENHCSQCEHFTLCLPAHFVNQCHDKTWFRSTLKSEAEIRAAYEKMKATDET